MIDEQRAVLAGGNGRLRLQSDLDRNCSKRSKIR